MSGAITFTNEQKLLIDHIGSTYVEACPGAGKTQTIAERFVVRPNQHPRKGVALLSFTNAAADEVQTRCSRYPELLLAPNFVGTIDKFINRFIVGPVTTSHNVIEPHFVDTWSQLPNAMFSVGGVQGEISLDWFTYDQGGNATLNQTQLPFKLRSSIKSLPNSQRETLNTKAKQLRDYLLSRGYHSAEASRAIAGSNLVDSAIRNQISKLFSNRFCEVIVDEAQDCSGDDIQLIEFLLEASIPVVLVGDPDQAIYEFRRKSGQIPPQLSSLVPRGKRLDGNFRSTPAICSITDSLRHTPNITDKATGRNKDNTAPVLVFGYDKPQDVAQCVILAQESYDIDPSDSVVLAHWTSVARSSAGGTKSDVSSTAKLTLIASHVECLKTENDGRRRRESLRKLSILLQEASANEVKDLPLEEFLTAIKLTQRQYETLVLRVAVATDFDREQPPSRFKEGLVSSLRDQGFSWAKAGALRTPVGDKWSGFPKTKEPLVRYGTIHSYKGLQSKFVTVVVPGRSPSQEQEGTGISQWYMNLDGEARRVLYVGVSRAEELLMLAVHESELSRALECLERDAVPIRLIQTQDLSIIDRT